jgi:hypothetical protein
MSAFLSSVWAWIQANPAPVAIIWAAFTALGSAFFAKEENDPGKFGQVVRFLEAIGFDWRKALNALKALFLGSGPGGSGGNTASGSGTTPPATGNGAAPPMAARTLAGLGARVIVALAAPLGLALLVDCASTQSASQIAADELTVTSYEAALQACILGAKANDSGLAGYEACADAVDQKYGAGRYADGGAE